MHEPFEAAGKRLAIQRLLVQHTFILHSRTKTTSNDRTRRFSTPSSCLKLAQVPRASHSFPKSSAVITNDLSKSIVLGGGAAPLPPPISLSSDDDLLAVALEENKWDHGVRYPALLGGDEKAHVG